MNNVKLEPKNLHITILVLWYYQFEFKVLFYFKNLVNIFLQIFLYGRYLY